MSTYSLEQAIIEAQARWGVVLKPKDRKEAMGPCPLCNSGVDRFLVFAEGNYWCRQCGKKGWLDEEGPKLSKEEMRLRRIEAEQARQARALVAHDERIAALEWMAECTDHLAYHLALTDDATNYWLSEGMPLDVVKQYKLGFCSRCPTDTEHRPSYTIPNIRDGVLLNIRHRLIGADGDKYRPHRRGLGTQLFNQDNLRLNTNRMMVVEGEKKSIVLDHHGFVNVGISGARSFRKEWVDLIKKFGQRIVLLDPDARDSAEKLARVLGARVVYLPVKADDFFVKYGGTAAQMAEFVRYARTPPQEVK